jgi:hypothetical protein
MSMGYEVAVGKMWCGSEWQPFWNGIWVFIVKLKIKVSCLVWN